MTDIEIEALRAHHPKTWLVVSDCTGTRPVAKNVARLLSRRGAPVEENSDVNVSTLLQWLEGGAFHGG
jgi:hypothetical protein